VAAERHQICPYYLAQDLVRWADVIVADYNYYFDTSASLYSSMIDSEWRVGVLVDEAHNLIDRARSMYSASLQLAQIKALRREVPALTRTWNRLIKHWRELKLPEVSAYDVLEQPPTSFLKALSTSSTDIGSYLVENAEAAPSLRDFYLATLHFLRRSESFDENSVYDVNRAAVRTASYSAKQIGTNKANSDTEVMLRNVVPAPYIGPRLAAADSVVLFSATLTPIDFYRGMLGVAEDARVAQVPSPFSSDQLQITVSRHISTRYKDRRASLDAITQLIADQHRQCPGNYLAFFSSFEYLELAANDLRERFPQLIQWRQTREMSEAAREEFVESFVEGGEGIGFAVLGGAFGEGIDLPGTKLIGAFIATLGLPPTDPINETYREVIDRKFGSGYDYTFTYPGIRKVVQASGRVIRTLSDQGILHLMDDRFASPAVQRLLPEWWLMNVARHPRRD
ncbi:MAG TPA: ATP-dependent DNA helicase, partial [Casimicrobium sp.]|nr:ATP-dependent DNA helicase [Casimicrobium sp.]